MRSSPYTPLRVKAKGKEISRFACCTDYPAHAPARAPARKAATRLVSAAVNEALLAFRGTRGPEPSDEAIWAAIAWRVGAENFAHAVIEKIAENNADGWPKRPAAAFQRFLGNRFPKPKGGAR